MRKLLSIRRRNDGCCRAVLGAALLLLAVLGCNRTGLPGMVPIRGKVTYDGKPLTNAEVRYVPASANEGRVARAKLDAEGNFQLTTLHSGDGALPGEYRVLVLAYNTVSVAARNEHQKKQEFELRSRIPEIYTQPRVTPLSDVVDGSHSGYKEFVLTAGEPTRNAGAARAAGSHE